MPRRSGSEKKLTTVEKRALLEMFAVDHSPLVRLGHRVGIDALEAMLDEFGGLKPHVPTSDAFWGRLAREIRNTQIQGRFHGNNLAELQCEYGLCERQLRAILTGRTSRRGRREAAKVTRISYSAADALSGLAGNAPSRHLFNALAVTLQRNPEFAKAVNDELRAVTDDAIAG